jgi:hypothetical protein
MQVLFGSNSSHVFVVGLVVPLLEALVLDLGAVLAFDQLHAVGARTIVHVGGALVGDLGRGLVGGLGWGSYRE